MRVHRGELRPVSIINLDKLTDAGNAESLADLAEKAGDRKGWNGETYNIGGENEQTNLAVLDALIGKVAAQAGKSPAVLHGLKKTEADPHDAGSAERRQDGADLSEADRPGHDRRYAINCDKIRNELGWTPRTAFPEGIRQTVRWYLGNPEGIRHVRSGEYKTWLEKNYGMRGPKA